MLTVLLEVVAYLFKIWLETSSVQSFVEMFLHRKASCKMCKFYSMSKFHQNDKIFLLNYFACRLGIGFSDLYVNQIAKDICTRNNETMR